MTRLFFPFASPLPRVGGMRMCFRIEELPEEEEEDHLHHMFSEDGEDGGQLAHLASASTSSSSSPSLLKGRPMVAKVFQENISNVVRRDYFSEASTQCMCQAFAANFNDEAVSRGVRGRIHFLACDVVSISKEEIARGRHLLDAALFDASAAAADAARRPPPVVRTPLTSSSRPEQSQTADANRLGSAATKKVSLDATTTTAAADAAATLTAATAVSTESTAEVRNKEEGVHLPSMRATLDLLDYTTEDTGDCFFAMEPLLKGEFVKYNTNSGDVLDATEDLNRAAVVRHEGQWVRGRDWCDRGVSVHRRSEARTPPTQQITSFSERSHLAECFSHFTLVQSGYAMLVCDLQGVHDVLTDPQIHTDTDEGAGLGLGNMGRDGIAKWVTAHVCSDLCRSMGLVPLITLRTTGGGGTTVAGVAAPASFSAGGSGAVSGARQRNDKTSVDGQTESKGFFGRLFCTATGVGAVRREGLTPAPADGGGAAAAASAEEQRRRIERLRAKAAVLLRAEGETAEAHERRLAAMPPKRQLSAVRARSELVQHAGSYDEFGRPTF